MSRENVTEVDVVDVSARLGEYMAQERQVQEFLNAKDDTSKFVGLALLKSLLDNQPQLRDDSDRVNALWEAISPKFLDRLLRACQNEKVTQQQAKNMVDIAVAVLHTFVILLPIEQRNDERAAGRFKNLVSALTNSCAETTVLVLQTLLSLVSQPLGALELIGLEDVSPLTKIASQYSLVLDVFSLAWTNASTKFSEASKVRNSIDRTIPLLLNTFDRTDAVTFLTVLGETLPKLPHEAIPDNPNWLRHVIVIWRRLVVSRPTLLGRSAYTQVAASLLQAYPISCPSLIFKDDGISTTQSKTFSYLFVNLLLVDLRSSFPSLLSKLNNTEYFSVSKRLAAAFDVVSSFIGFLVRSLEDGDDLFKPTTINMTPDLLLKLRKDIAETMSLTIEYMRDRWDASVAGVAGLHPSARSGPSATSEGSRLTLTWDSMKDNITSDILILACIRALAIWLREDDNEELRNESAGLMDMFVELYVRSSSTDLDFRYPILTALEAVLTTEDGINNLLTQNGLEVLSRDLRSILANGVAKATPSLEGEASRGIEIIRALLAVIDHPSTMEPREDWMEIVKLAASIRQTSFSGHPIILELHVAVLQLATALLILSPSSMLKRYSSKLPALVGLAIDLRTAAERLRDTISQDLCNSLDDVLMDLETLR